MQTLPTSVYTPASVGKLDQRAIAAGIPAHQLMARAGRAAWQMLREHFPQAKRIVVLCGGGNNAGDGYVIARLAADAGCTVSLCALSDPAKLQGAAAMAAQQALAQLQTVSLTESRLAQADVVVDALLGTGLDRPVEGKLAGAIERVNQAGVPVLAVDVPSGLSAASGQVLGVAIQATLTATFIGLKQGLFTGVAADYVGQIRFADCGVPAEVFTGVEPSAQRLSSQWLTGQLLRRAASTHKGQCGHVLVIGGDHGMGGAVRMAAEAAARSGAGRVSVATRAAHVSALLAARPELMVHAVESTAELQALLARADVVAIGPGLGQSEWGQAMVAAVWSADQPLVVDADALNLLAQHPQQRAQWVLTPHPGEAARLLNQSVATVQADRFAASAALSAQYGGVSVLKGAGSIIRDAQECALCTAGNPGMASGGMGDVLTGVIAAFVAQGLPLMEAACAGVQVHAMAADVAARAGERGLLAGDVIAALRQCVNPHDD